MNEAAEYVAEEFLREIDPMPWYRAISGLAPNLGIEDPEVKQKMSEETALRVLRRIAPYCSQPCQRCKHVSGTTKTIESLACIRYTAFNT